MKKLYYLICIACALITLSLNVRADVTIRFWDNGVLVHTATEDEPGVHTIATYYSQTPASCDGYTFIGWKADSPIVNETVYANDAATGITSSVTIGTDDIDVYAVYKKSVTCYTKIDAASGLEDGGKYLVVGYKSSDNSYHAMSNTDVGTRYYWGVSSSVVTPCTNNTIYSVDASCIWNLSTNSNNYILRNNANSKYLYVKDPGNRYYMLQSNVSSKLTCEVNSGAWTIYSTESYTVGILQRLFRIYLRFSTL